MDFLNKAKNSIQNVGKEVSKKTKDIGGTMSLNNQIKEAESTLNQIYQQIGQKYYNECNTEAVERFPEECQQIVAIMEKMAKDKEQLRALKGLKLCPNCGADVDIQLPHCPMCGTAVEVPVAAFEPVAPAETSAFCPGCGTQLTPGTKFCGKCGTKIG